MTDQTTPLSIDQRQSLSPDHTDLTSPDSHMATQDLHLVEDASVLEPVIKKFNSKESRLSSDCWPEDITPARRLKARLVRRRLYSGPDSQDEGYGEYSISPSSAGSTNDDNNEVLGSCGQFLRIRPPESGVLINRRLSPLSQLTGSVALDASAPFISSPKQNRLMSVLDDPYSCPSRSKRRSTKKTFYSDQEKMKAIILAKSSSVLQAARTKKINRATLYTWVRQYDKKCRAYISSGGVDTDKVESIELDSDVEVLDEMVYRSVQANKMGVSPSPQRKGGLMRREEKEKEVVSQNEEVSLGCQVSLRKLSQRDIMFHLSAGKISAVDLVNNSAVDPDSNNGPIKPKRKRTARLPWQTDFPLATSPNQVMHCTSCRLQFACESHLDIHIGECHTKLLDGVQVCEICGSTNSPFSCLKRHMREVQRLAWRRQLAPLAVVLPVKCQVCRVRRRSREQLNTHIRNCHKDCVSQQDTWTETQQCSEDEEVMASILDILASPQEDDIIIEH